MSQHSQYNAAGHQGAGYHTPYDTSQEPGYFPPQEQSSDGQIGGLAAQIGNMGIGADATNSARPNKKKHRHAHHLDQAAGSQLNSPTPTQGTPSSFQDGRPGFQQMGSSSFTPMQDSYGVSPGLSGNPYSGQAITSAMTQFPAQGGFQFSPTPGTQFSPGIQSSSAGYGSPGFGTSSFGTPSFGTPNNAITTPSGPGVSAQGKVDPEQVPSVARARDLAAEYYLDHIYPTMEHHLPPPGAVPYVAHDQGNSSPKYARLTLNNIPSTSEALASTALPLGLVLQPLALLQEGEQPIPVLDFGDAGPPRCRRCRTYINPFMTFRSGGDKLVCNMCTFPNDVTQEYFAPTDATGVRVDRAQRPELTTGTVEYLVPKEYWAKEPVGLRWLFLIDVGQEAVNKGFLEAFCEGILGALYGNDESHRQNGEDDQDLLPRRNIPEGSKVGFVTFDKIMHFYNCSDKLERAQMLVMPDIEDPFVPLGSESLFVDPYESKSVISSLLTQLPDLFSQVKNPEPALLPTLDAALAALKTTGGKIICSLSALPTWGPGRLFLRDEGKLHGIETEKKLFQTEHPEWRKTAAKMVESGVGVDFFVAAAGGGYMDIATIGHVSAVTGGEMFLYTNFISPRDTFKVAQEVKHTLTRETGYQALMKVRCSNGLQVAAYHGNFLQNTFGADLEFGVIDADKAIGVMFSYDGKLDAKLDAHFQSALLYTTASGQRRVRCTNTVASVTEGASMAGMRFIDQDAVVNVVAKEAATRMTEKPIKDIRSALTEKTVDILAGYRKAFSGTHPPGQLVLPENLKEFSMCILGLLKSRAFKAGHEPSDRRTHVMRLIKSMGALELSLMLYPRIIALHTLSPESGFPSLQTGHLVLPPTIRASFSRIENGGAYLVDDGQICILWLHANVSPNFLEDLFGPDKSSLAALDPMLSSLPVLDTHLNAQARNILAYWARVRGSKAMSIQLARQGMDGAEFEFARLLFEDRNNEQQSYVDWLVNVHRAIQLELAGQRKREDGGGEGAISGITALKPPYW